MEMFWDQLPMINISDLEHAGEETSVKHNLESLNVMTAGIAHDLVNVLSGVLTEAELLALSLPVASEPVQALERIKAGVMLGVEFARDLMLHAGQNPAKVVQALDISGLVEHVLELLRISLSKHVLLKTDLRANLSVAAGNAAQIRQVVGWVWP